MDSRIWKHLTFPPTECRPVDRVLGPGQSESGSGPPHSPGHDEEGDDDGDVEGRADIGWPALVAALGTPTLHYALGRGPPRTKKEERVEAL